MIRGIFHVNIVCRDMERSLAFYCGLLGARIVATLGEDGTESADLARLMGFSEPAACVGHLLRFGPDGSPGSYTTIDLVRWIRPDVTGAPYSGMNHVGIARICLPVTGIDEMYRTLSAAGVEFLSPPVDIPVRLHPDRFSCFRMCCLKDPDGVVLELSEPVG